MIVMEGSDCSARVPRAMFSIHHTIAGETPALQRTECGLAEMSMKDRLEARPYNNDENHLKCHGKFSPPLRNH